VRSEFVRAADRGVSCPLTAYEDALALVLPMRQHLYWMIDERCVLVRVGEDVGEEMLPEQLQAWSRLCTRRFGVSIIWMGSFVARGEHEVGHSLRHCARTKGL
jgi:hypothetical protein